MTDSKKPAEKAQNYSEEQVKLLKANVPFDLEKARLFADKPEFKDKSWQSIVAKLKNLGLEYIPKPAPRKKAVQATKAELVDVVSALLDRDCSGLEKATRSAILVLINGLQHAIPSKEEPSLPEIGDSAS